MLRKVASPARLAGMLRSVCTPDFKEALQVCSAACPVPVYALGGWRQNSFHIGLLCQVLQGASTDGEPAHVLSMRVAIQGTLASQYSAGRLLSNT